jgi:hypothetical protein
MNVKSVKELNGYTEDYFNFQFEDMELHFITRFSPAFSEFSEDNRLHVKSHFNHMLQFLETGLAQLTSPYLKSTVNHYLNKLTTKIEQKYFMMFLFKNEQSISSSLKKFFIKLINVKNFSIDNAQQPQIVHHSSLNTLQRAKMANPHKKTDTKRSFCSHSPPLMRIKREKWTIFKPQMGLTHSKATFNCNKFQLHLGSNELILTYTYL